MISAPEIKNLDKFINEDEYEVDEEGVVSSLGWNSVQRSKLLGKEKSEPDEVTITKLSRSAIK